LKQFIEEFPEWSAWAVSVRQWLIEHGLPFNLENLHTAINALKNGIVDVRYMSHQVELNLLDLIAQTREAHEKAKVLVDVANILWASLEMEFRRAVDKGYILPWQELKQLKDEIHHV
jgi:hypothetical protein